MSSEIVIEVNAEDYVGQLLKGATIIVGGDIGDDAGLCMVGGKFLS